MYENKEKVIFLVNSLNNSFPFQDFQSDLESHSDQSFTVDEVTKVGLL